METAFSEMLKNAIASGDPIKLLSTLVFYGIVIREMRSLKAEVKSIKQTVRGVAKEARDVKSSVGILGHRVTTLELFRQSIAGVLQYKKHFKNDSREG